MPDANDKTAPAKNDEKPDGPPPIPGAAQEAAEAAASGAAERVWTDAEVKAALAQKEAEGQDRLMRLAAEYQNFRRRADKDRELDREETLGKFVSDLLPVIDTFEKALALRADPAAALSGIDGTEKLLRTALAKHGVMPVDPAGQPFDPKLHEALVRAPSADKAPGTVLHVMEKGWVLRARLLRPARVAVAAAPEGK